MCWSPPPTADMLAAILNELSFTSVVCALTGSSLWEALRVGQEVSRRRAAEAKQQFARELPHTGDALQWVKQLEY